MRKKFLISKFMNKIRNQLRLILKKTFPNAKVPISKKDLKFGDFVEWDSLGQLNFLLAIEKKYEIKFSINEMLELKSFSQICKAINKRRNK